MSGSTSVGPDIVTFICGQKVFFVVQFDNQKYFDYVINEGPWFWGRVGLFVTLWFPGFDANSMVVTKWSIWVRLHNLPLLFWQHEVLEVIGNSLGRFLKMDREKMDKGMFNFSHICVEMDLNKGIPNRIHLTHQDFKWTPWLYFENTAFRC